METWNPPVARALKPARVVAGDWRGAQVIASDGVTVTVRLHLEQHLIGTRTAALALFAGLSTETGAPCVVRVTDPDYTIAEVHGARFVGVTGPGTDQAGAVARGEFHPGEVAYHLTNESEYWEP